MCSSDNADPTVPPDDPDPSPTVPPEGPCTRLDPAWNHLTTAVNFPADTGTVLTVSCKEGFKLRGSNTITCTAGTTFSSDTSPSCFPPGTGVAIYYKIFTATQIPIPLPCFHPTSLSPPRPFIYPIAGPW